MKNSPFLYCGRRKRTVPFTVCVSHAVYFCLALACFCKLRLSFLLEGLEECTLLPHPSISLVQCLFLKVFIELFTIFKFTTFTLLLLLFVFYVHFQYLHIDNIDSAFLCFGLVFRLGGTWYLSSPTGGRTHSPCIGRQREVPGAVFIVGTACSS